MQNVIARTFPLSIITVCFNEAARIALTCESVVNQTFQDFEWIVIDGGSTDGTLDILKKYERRMNYFVSEPDRGIYHAMNKGIAQAHGKYLLFLNGGDYLYETETLANIFSGNSILDHDIYYGDLVLEREQNLKYYTIDFTNVYATFARRTLPHQATFIKRTLFQTYGMYDESFTIAADLEFFLRVFVSNPYRKQHTIEHLPFIISVFEKDGISSRSLKQRYIENRNIRKRHYPAWYLIYYHIKRWLTRHKKRGIDSVKYRFHKFITKKASC